MATGDSIVNRLLRDWDRLLFEGVLLRRLVSHGDDRGSLMELWRIDEMLPKHTPTMGYFSMTNPGVARGPHEHNDQTDLFVFTPGFELRLWDNRDISETFKKHLFLQINEPTAVIVPPGVVHGYVNKSSVPALSLNFPNRLYKGQGKKLPVDEIRHESSPDSPFKMF